MENLNLIPYELKEKRKNRLKQMKYAVIASGIVLLLLIAIAIPELRLVLLKHQKASIDMQISDGASILNENKKLTTEIDSINQYINKVELLSKQRIIVSSQIKDLGKCIPKDVVIQTLSYSNGNISITGETKNYDSISEFGANLQGTKEYSKAVIGSINFNQQMAKYTFSLAIEQQGGNKDEKAK